MGARSSINASAASAMKKRASIAWRMGADRTAEEMEVGAIFAHNNPHARAAQPPPAAAHDQAGFLELLG
jgi:hypothetical protein